MGLKNVKLFSDIFGRKNANDSVQEPPASLSVGSTKTFTSGQLGGDSQRSSSTCCSATYGGHTKKDNRSEGKKHFTLSAESNALGETLQSTYSCEVGTLESKKFDQLLTRSHFLAFAEEVEMRWEEAQELQAIKDGLAQPFLRDKSFSSSHYRRYPSHRASVGGSYSFRNETSEFASVLVVSDKVLIAWVATLVDELNYSMNAFTLSASSFWGKSIGTDHSAKVDREETGVSCSLEHVFRLPSSIHTERTYGFDEARESSTQISAPKMQLDLPAAAGAVETSHRDRRKSIASHSSHHKKNKETEKKVTQHTTNTPARASSECAQTTITKERSPLTEEQLRQALRAVTILSHCLALFPLLLCPEWGADGKVLFENLQVEGATDHMLWRCVQISKEGDSCPPLRVFSTLLDPTPEETQDKASLETKSTTSGQSSAEHPHSCSTISTTKKRFLFPSGYDLAHHLFVQQSSIVTVLNFLVRTPVSSTMLQTGRTAVLMLACHAYPRYPSHASASKSSSSFTPGHSLSSDSSASSTVEPCSTSCEGLPLMHENTFSQSASSFVEALTSSDRAHPPLLSLWGGEGSLVAVLFQVVMPFVTKNVLSCIDFWLISLLTEALRWCDESRVGVFDDIDVLPKSAFSVDSRIKRELHCSTPTTGLDKENVRKSFPCSSYSPSDAKKGSLYLDGGISEKVRVADALGILQQVFLLVAALKTKSAAILLAPEVEHSVSDKVPKNATPQETLTLRPSAKVFNVNLDSASRHSLKGSHKVDSKEVASPSPNAIIILPSWDESSIERALRESRHVVTLTRTSGSAGAGITASERLESLLMQYGIADFSLFTLSTIPSANASMATLLALYMALLNGLVRGLSPEGKREVFTVSLKGGQREYPKRSFSASGASSANGKYENESLPYQAIDFKQEVVSVWLSTASYLHHARSFFLVNKYTTALLASGVLTLSSSPISASFFDATASKGVTSPLTDVKASPFSTPDTSVPIASTLHSSFLSSHSTLEPSKSKKKKSLSVKEDHFFFLPLIDQNSLIGEMTELWLDWCVGTASVSLESIRAQWASRSPYSSFWIADPPFEEEKVEPFDSLFFEENADRLLTELTRRQLLRFQRVLQEERAYLSALESPKALEMPDLIEKIAVVPRTWSGSAMGIPPFVGAASERGMNRTGEPRAGDGGYEEQMWCTAQQLSKCIVPAYGPALDGAASLKDVSGLSSAFVDTEDNLGLQRLAVEALMLVPITHTRVCGSLYNQLLASICALSLSSPLNAKRFTEWGVVHVLIARLLLVDDSDRRQRLRKTLQEGASQRKVGDGEEERSAHLQCARDLTRSSLAMEAPGTTTGLDHSGSPAGEKRYRKDPCLYCFLPLEAGSGAPEYLLPLAGLFYGDGTFSNDNASLHSSSSSREKRESELVGPDNSSSPSLSSRRFTQIFSVPPRALLYQSFACDMTEVTELDSLWHIDLVYTKWGQRMREDSLDTLRVITGNFFAQDTIFPLLIAALHRLRRTKSVPIPQREASETQYSPVLPNPSETEHTHFKHDIEMSIFQALLHSFREAHPRFFLYRKYQNWPALSGDLVSTPCLGSHTSINSVGDEGMPNPSPSSVTRERLSQDSDALRTQKLQSSPLIVTPKFSKLSSFFFFPPGTSDRGLAAPLQRLPPPREGYTASAWVYPLWIEAKNGVLLFSFYNNVDESTQRLYMLACGDSSKELYFRVQLLRRLSEEEARASGSFSFVKFPEDSSVTVTSQVVSASSDSNSFWHEYTATVNTSFSDNQSLIEPTSQPTYEPSNATGAFPSQFGTCPPPAFPESWIHVAYTHSMSNWTLYVQGLPILELSLPYSSSVKPSKVGRGASVPSPDGVILFGGEGTLTSSLERHLPPQTSSEVPTLLARWVEDVRLMPQPPRFSFMVEEKNYFHGYTTGMIVMHGALDSLLIFQLAQGGAGLSCCEGLQHLVLSHIRQHSFSEILSFLYANKSDGLTVCQNFPFTASILKKAWSGQSFKEMLRTKMKHQRAEGQQGKREYLAPTQAALEKSILVEVEKVFLVSIQCHSLETDEGAGTQGVQIIPLPSLLSAIHRYKIVDESVKTLQLCGKPVKPSPDCSAVALRVSTLHALLARHVCLTLIASAFWLAEGKEQVSSDNVESFAPLKEGLDQQLTWQESPEEELQRMEYLWSFIMPSSTTKALESEILSWQPWGKIDASLLLMLATMRDGGKTASVFSDKVNPLIQQRKQEMSLKNARPLLRPHASTISILSAILERLRHSVWMQRYKSSPIIHFTSLSLEDAYPTSELMQSQSFSITSQTELTKLKRAYGVQPYHSREGTGRGFSSSTSHDSLLFRRYFIPSTEEGLAIHFSTAEVAGQEPKHFCRSTPEVAPISIDIVSSVLRTLSMTLVDPFNAKIFLSVPHSYTRFLQVGIFSPYSQMREVVEVMEKLCKGTREIRQTYCFLLDPLIPDMDVFLSMLMMREKEFPASPSVVFSPNTPTSFSENPESLQGLPQWDLEHSVVVNAHRIRIETRCEDSAKSFSKQENEKVYLDNAIGAWRFGRSAIDNFKAQLLCMLYEVSRIDESVLKKMANGGVEKKIDERLKEAPLGVQLSSELWHDRLMHQIELDSPQLLFHHENYCAAKECTHRTIHGSLLFSSDRPPQAQRKNEVADDLPFDTSVVHLRHKCSYHGIHFLLMLIQGNRIHSEERLRLYALRVLALILFSYEKIRKVFTLEYRGYSVWVQTLSAGISDDLKAYGSSTEGEMSLSIQPALLKKHGDALPLQQSPSKPNEETVIPEIVTDYWEIPIQLPTLDCLFHVAFNGYRPSNDTGGEGVRALRTSASNPNGNQNSVRSSRPPERAPTTQTQFPNFYGYVPRYSLSSFVQSYDSRKAEAVKKELMEARNAHETSEGALVEPKSPAASSLTSVSLSFRRLRFALEKPQHHREDPQTDSDSEEDEPPLPSQSSSEDNELTQELANSPEDEGSASQKRIISNPRAMELVFVAFGVLLHRIGRLYAIHRRAAYLASGIAHLPSHSSAPSFADGAGKGSRKGVEDAGQAEGKSTTSPFTRVEATTATSKWARAEAECLALKVLYPSLQYMEKVIDHPQNAAALLPFPWLEWLWKAFQWVVLHRKPLHKKKKERVVASSSMESNQRDEEKGNDAESGFLRKSAGSRRTIYFPEAITNRVMHLYRHLVRRLTVLDMSSNLRASSVLRLNTLPQPADMLETVIREVCYHFVSRGGEGAIDLRHNLQRARFTVNNFAYLLRGLIPESGSPLSSAKDCALVLSPNLGTEIVSAINTITIHNVSTLRRFMKNEAQLFWIRDFIAIYCIKSVPKLKTHDCHLLEKMLEVCSSNFGILVILLSRLVSAVDAGDTKEVRSVVFLLWRSLLLTDRRSTVVETLGPEGLPLSEIICDFFSHDSHLERNDATDAQMGQQFPSMEQLKHFTSEARSLASPSLSSFMVLKSAPATLGLYHQHEPREESNSRHADDSVKHSSPSSPYCTQVTSKIIDWCNQNPEKLTVISARIRKMLEKENQSFNSSFRSPLATTGSFDELESCDTLSSEWAWRLEKAREKHFQHRHETQKIVEEVWKIICTDVQHLLEKEKE